MKNKHKKYKKLTLTMHGEEAAEIEFMRLGSEEIARINTKAQTSWLKTTGLSFEMCGNAVLIFSGRVGSVQTSVFGPFAPTPELLRLVKFCAARKARQNAERAAA